MLLFTAFYLFAFVTKPSPLPHTAPILVKRVISCYRPQRSCGQGNIFTPVCHSVHSGGVCLSACPPRADTPPEQTPPPGSRQPTHPPPTRPPPWSRHQPPPPGADTPPPGSRLQHTVYERPVRILLECILVDPKISREKKDSDTNYYQQGKCYDVQYKAQ